MVLKKHPHDDGLLASQIAATSLPRPIMVSGSDVEENLSENEPVVDPSLAPFPQPRKEFNPEVQLQKEEPEIDDEDEDDIEIKDFSNVSHDVVEPTDEELPVPVAFDDEEETLSEEVEEENAPQPMEVSSTPVRKVPEVVQKNDFTLNRISPQNPMVANSMNLQREPLAQPQRFANQPQSRPMYTPEINPLLAGNVRSNDVIRNGMQSRNQSYPSLTQQLNPITTTTSMGNNDSVNEEGNSIWKTIAMIVAGLVIVVLIIGGGYLSVTFFMKDGTKETVSQEAVVSTMPKVTSSPSPTVAPTATPTVMPTPAMKKSEVKINILNGSGVKGEASKAKALLEKSGYSDFATGNADNFDYKKTEISYKKGFEAFVPMIVTDLSASYTAVKGEELPASSKYDIVITLGSTGASTTAADTKVTPNSVTATPKTTVTPKATVKP